MVYHLIRMNVPLGDGTREWRYYAKEVASGHSTLMMIAEAIADKTTVTPTDVLAVTDALWREIYRLLREGQIVELGALGNFQLIIRNHGGSLTKKDWKVALIKDAYVRHRSTKSMRLITEDVKFTRWVNLEAEQILNAAHDAKLEVRKAEQDLVATQRLLKKFQADAAANPSSKLKAYMVIETQAHLDTIDSQLIESRLKVERTAAAVERMKAANGGGYPDSEVASAPEVLPHDLSDIDSDDLQAGSSSEELPEDQENPKDPKDPKKGGSDSEAKIVMCINSLIN